mgnify:FL=1
MRDFTFFKEREREREKVSMIIGLLTVLGIALISIGVIVILMKRRFLLKEDHRHDFLILLAAFSWVIGLMGTVLLPLDVVKYGSKDYDENLANIVWKSNYYLSLFLTWVACPLAVAYLNSNAFTTKSRIYDAIVGEFKYNAMLLILCLIVVVGTVVVFGTETIRTRIEPFLISFSNFYGLLLVVLCLGHGLIDFPTRFLVCCGDENDPSLWLKSNHKHVMNVYNDYMTQSQKLGDVCGEITRTVPSDSVIHKEDISKLYDRVRKLLDLLSISLTIEHITGTI